MRYPTHPGAKTGGTSEEAAESMVGKAATLRALVRALITNSPAGLTADEAAEKLGESILSIRPRFSELRAAGVIYDSGTRRQNASGRNAVVWTIYKQGEQIALFIEQLP